MVEILSSNASSHLTKQMLRIPATPMKNQGLLRLDNSLKVKNILFHSKYCSRYFPSSASPVPACQPPLETKTSHGKQMVGIQGPLPVFPSWLVSISQGCHLHKQTKGDGVKERPGESPLAEPHPMPELTQPAPAIEMVINQSKLSCLNSPT